LDRPIAARIIGKLEQLALRVERVEHIALTGQWRGYYRLRVGNYRAVYRLDHDAKVVIVEYIGHRRNVYDA
jgi:mRNA interferase RelE/StbE